MEKAGGAGKGGGVEKAGGAGKGGEVEKAGGAGKGGEVEKAGGAGKGGEVEKAGGAGKGGGVEKAGGAGKGGKEKGKQGKEGRGVHKQSGKNGICDQANNISPTDHKRQHNYMYSKYTSVYSCSHLEPSSISTHNNTHKLNHHSNSDPGASVIQCYYAIIHKYT